VLQGCTVQKFHGDEGAPFVVADVVDGADVGMIERRGGTGLAAKALQRLRVTSCIIGKKLEGDEAT
jgi:hypothetical protein